MNLSLPSALHTSDAIASIALLVAIVAARLIAGRALHNRDNLSDQVARRWSANVRNLLILVAVVGLIMIWAPQLRTFALSLTAVAVAIVVATKELILCLSGAALRTFTRAFSVGDIVEIGTSKGEVLDINLLAVRLKEFDDREGSIAPTGRTIILPYSLLFSTPAKVLPHLSEEIAHTFDMTFEPDVNIFALRENLNRVATAAVRDKLKGKGAEPMPPAVSPNCQIQFGTSEIGKYRLTISIQGVSGDHREMENEVACAIGSFVHSLDKPSTLAPNE